MFALPYLALHPDIQEWVFEEVDQYLSKRPETSYQDTYPKLIRCQALMYETLRVASPAPQMARAPITPASIPVQRPAISRKPKSTFQSASATSDTVIVEPDTIVTTHFYGAHLSPRWGADAHEFNPRRFVTRSSTGEETLLTPTSFADAEHLPIFLPWLFGPRVCPGKKFSQVEFVAVIAQVLSTYRIDVGLDGLKAGEFANEEARRMAARQNLHEVMDEKYFNISVHVKRPEAATLSFRKRG